MRHIVIRINNLHLFVQKKSKRLVIVTLVLILACGLNLKGVVNSEADSLYDSALKLFFASQHYESINLFKKSLQTYHVQNNDERIIRCYLRLSESYNYLLYKDSSMYFANKANKKAKHISISDELQYRIWYNYGWNYYKNNIDSALFYLNKSVKLNQNANNTKFLLRTMSLIGTTYIWHSMFDTALIVFTKTLELAQSVNNYYEIITCYRNIGHIYSTRRDIKNARYYYKKAIELNNRKKVMLKTELISLYKSLGTLNLYDNLNFNEAHEYYKKAEQIALSIYKQSHPEFSYTYLYHARIFRWKNQYYKALNYSHKALDHTLIYDSTNYRRLAYIYNGTALIYYYMKDYTNAIIYLHETIKYDKMIPGLGHIYLDYRTLAECYLEIKNYEKAMTYFSLAEKEYIKRFKENSYGPGVIDVYLGRLYLENNEIEKGFNRLKKGLDILLQITGEKYIYVSYHYKFLGEYYSKINQPLEALKNYQKAITSLMLNFNDTSIYAAPDISGYTQNEDIYHYLIKKAILFKRLYAQTSDKNDLISSLENWNTAIIIFQNFEINSTVIQDKLRILGTGNNIFDEAIEVAHKLYDLTGDNIYAESAYKISEQGKAWLLQSVVNNSNAQVSSGIPDSLLEKERDLKIRFNALKYQGTGNNSKTDSNDVVIYNEELFKVQKEMDDLSDFIEKEYPQYSNMKYNTEILSIEEVQQKLSKSNALFEFYMTDSSLYTFYIDNENLEFSKHPAKEIISRLNDFIEHYYYPDFSQEIVFTKDDLNTLHFIYNKLFKPYEKLFGNKNLIIIPDKEFAYLPFEILLTEEPGNYENYKELPYLLRDNPIQYSYSSNTLFKTIRKQQKNKSGLIAFAPTYQHVTAIQDTAVFALRENREFLVPIPYAIKEVQNISKFFKSKIYTDYEASETNFKKDIQNSSILHLAMHTIIDETRPLYSKLAFTLKADTAEDGLLNAYEIYNLNANNDLVVLSACKTGFGKLEKGEGVMSIARAFAYAGCPSVVTSLWSIEDRASSAVMTNFYKYLSKGKTKSEALRKAKLEYLENADPFKSHPFFWAAHVQIGDNSAVKRNNSVLYIVLSSLLLGLVIFIVLFRKK